MPIEMDEVARRAEVARLGDEIALLSAHLTVAIARLLNLIREFDALGGWGDAGAKSCAEWLSWRVGLQLRAAYEHVRVARALPQLPLITAALARAEISYSKVRALTRVATPQTEERLLAFAKSGTATHVERLTRAWRRIDRSAEDQEAEQQHQSRTLSMYQDVDGMWVIRGRLTPEVGAVVRQALTAATDRLYAESRHKVPGQYVPTTSQHRRPWHHRGSRAPARPRPGHVGGALPGGRPRGRRRSGRSRSAGSVGAGRGALFRGTLAANRLRCQPGGHEA